MSPQPSSEILEALEQSATEVLAAANVPESLAGRKPAEDRWSVLDCIEHLARVEASFLDRLQPIEGAAPATDGRKESDLARRMADRTDRRQAPDPVRPTGRFTTLGEALAEFQATRARAAKFAVEHASDLASFAATSPRWGVLSGREVMLLLAGHTRRHAAQIRETVERLTMSPQQRSEIAETLEQSREEFLAAANVPESLASLKPEEGRWSVLDCIEHVTTVEQVFLGRLKPAEGDPPPANRDREAEILGIVLDRTSRRQAPEAIHPKGRFASLTQAVEEFNAVRARTAQFAEEQGPGLYSLTVTHPVLGPMNGKEALILIAGHARRHAAQMRETAAALAAR
jgi:uncharacterized damage-inducible protein DinB